MIRFFLLLYTGCLLIACSGTGIKDSTIRSGPNNIAFTDCGNADTTLVFVHGWGINRGYWTGQLDFFCPRYRVVTIDLPGFGTSGKELGTDWQFSDYSEDLLQLIRSLQLKQVILIGHSMSGDLVLDLARKKPEWLLGVVGVDNLHAPAPLLQPEARMQMDIFFRIMAVRYDSVVRTVMPAQLFQPATDAAVRKRVMDDILSNDPAIAVRVLKENAFFSEQQAAAMRTLKQPLLLVNSDAYPVDDSLLKATCAQGYRLAVIPGSGHYPMIEQPGLFNTALQQLLDGMKPIIR